MHNSVLCERPLVSATEAVMLYSPGCDGVKVQACADFSLTSRYMTRRAAIAVRSSSGKRSPRP